MRALSIRQPWAWAILRAGKRVENRVWTWAPMWRETFLIHASKGCTVDEFDDAIETIVDITGSIACPPLKDMPRGAIVGRARLVGAHINAARGTAWAVPDALHLLLADVDRLLTPIPFKGALGFFDVPDSLLVGAEWERMEP